MQASDKRRIQLPEWKRKLDAVKIRKEDMNKLIMNFLVTEVLVPAPHRALAAFASACGLNLTLSQAVGTLGSLGCAQPMPAVALLCSALRL